MERRLLTIIALLAIIILASCSVISETPLNIQNEGNITITEEDQTVFNGEEKIYLVFTPVSTDLYLVRFMNETQYTILTDNDLLDGSSVYTIDLDMDTVAQSGIIGMHTEEEIIQFIKDDNILITHVKGPVFGDDTGGTD